ncbi:MAG: tetratricopeptide repeat protein [Candidatus Aminicenantes bacterium]|nr:tetratricopeptide repeat protein [Candidatus Aminicenantes bacterium]
MRQKERHRLMQNDLAFGFRRLVVFGKKFGRQLAMAGVVLVVLVLIYLGIQFFRAQGEKKDSEAIAEVIALRDDLPKNPGNLAKLQGFKGKAGRLADVLVAAYWVEQGDLDKAEASIGRVKENPKDNIYFQAQGLLAQVYFWRKNYDKSIEIYKAILAENPKDYPLDGVMFHQAEALEKKGQKAEALALYKKLQSDYAQTYFGYEAQTKVASLETAK